MDIREMLMALQKIGLSQESIAFGVHVNKSTVNRILRGKTTSPRYNLVGRVERLFLDYCK